MTDQHWDAIEALGGLVSQADGGGDEALDVFKAVVAEYERLRATMLAVRDGLNSGAVDDYEAERPRIVPSTPHNRRYGNMTEELSLPVRLRAISDGPAPLSQVAARAALLEAANELERRAARICELEHEVLQDRGAIEEAKTDAWMWRGIAEDRGAREPDGEPCWTTVARKHLVVLVESEQRPQEDVFVRTLSGALWRVALVLEAALQDELPLAWRVELEPVDAHDVPVDLVPGGLLSVVGELGWNVRAGRRRDDMSREQKTVVLWHGQYSNDGRERLRILEKHSRTLFGLRNPRLIGTDGAWRVVADAFVDAPFVSDRSSAR